MKYIGIVGSRRRRTREDQQKVEEAFFKVYEPGDRIVSGGCMTGADRFAEILAIKKRIPILIHYANWGLYGKKAGFLRNGDIAWDASVLIACVAEDRTGGTEDTIEKFCDKHPGQQLILV